METLSGHVFESAERHAGSKAVVAGWKPAPRIFPSNPHIIAEKSTFFVDGRTTSNFVKPHKTFGRRPLAVYAATEHNASAALQPNQAMGLFVVGNS